VIKAAKRGTPVFVKTTDISAVDSIRNENANTDLLIFVCCFKAPEPSAQRVYPLYFRIGSEHPEKARVSALEAFQYITQTSSVPDDCIEVLYNSGRDIGDNKADFSPDRL
jgi:hypothetical protein